MPQQEELLLLLGGLLCKQMLRQQVGSECTTHTQTHTQDPQGPKVLGWHGNQVIWLMRDWHHNIIHTEEKHIALLEHSKAAPSHTYNLHTYHREKLNKNSVVFERSQSIMTAN